MNGIDADQASDRRHCFQGRPLELHHLRRLHQGLSGSDSDSDIIVQMRRHLALEEGDFPEGLAQALENTSSVGNPWGMDPGSRLKWGQGLDVEIAKPGRRVRRALLGRLFG